METLKAETEREHLKVDKEHLSFEKECLKLKWMYYAKGPNYWRKAYIKKI